MYKSLLAYALPIYAITLLIIVLYCSHLEITPKRASVTIPDFSKITNVKEKKQAFFDYFRPIIEKRNARLTRQKQVLAQLKQNYNKRSKLSKKESETLIALIKQFDLSANNDINQSLTELAKRVNTLPSSLALAQAAKESAWGTSRFARKANNFFGQWCFTQGCGLVPLERNNGAIHEVKKFDSPEESVISYFRNINTHSAYQNLREIRYTAEQNNINVTGKMLADGLLNYSEKKEAYVEELKAMIRINKLEPDIDSATPVNP